MPLLRAFTPDRGNQFHVIQRRGFSPVRMPDDFHYVTLLQFDAHCRMPGRGVAIHLVRGKMVVRYPGIDPMIVDHQFVVRDSIVLIKVLGSDPVESGRVVAAIGRDAIESETRRTGAVGLTSNGFAA